MLIIQVYHDSGCMHDFCRMPNSGQKMWLQSEDMTSFIYSDSDHTSRLWLMSRLRSFLLTLVVHHGSIRWAGRMCSHLSYERLHMVELDDCNILQPGHLVRSRLGGVHDSFSVQNLIISRLRMFKCQVMCHATGRHLAQLDLIETSISRRTR
jgi:hypothetical protein